MMDSPMKIAFIVQWFPALSESFILRQITFMIDRGHAVQILSQYRTNETTLHQSVVPYGLLSKTTFGFTIPRGKWARRLKAAILSAVQLLASPRRTVRLLNACWQGKGQFDFPALFLGLKCLNKSFDLLHAHFGPSGNTGLALKRFGVAPRLITSFHGYDVTAYVQKAGTGVYRRLFEQGDGFTYNSDATKAILDSLGCLSDSCVKLPMGIDVASIPFRPRTPRPGEPIRLLSVGRLVEMKGREYAIRAVAKVATRFSKLDYTIIGDGPLRDSLHQLIRELKMDNRIRLLGPVDDTRLDQFYRDSHILLHPSVVDREGNREGQGVVLLEAQAHGMMVVATRHNAFVETVLDGQTGFLVPERDSDALAEKILYLLNHPEIWPSIVAVARSRVESLYDIRQLNNRLETLYEDLLSASQIEN
jgi:colanic acid/amylovoran biosynthesis glycosyltransferase